MHTLDKLKEVEGKLAHVNSVLGAGGIEDWEAKEYSDLHESYCRQIAELMDHIIYMNDTYGKLNW